MEFLPFTQQKFAVTLEKWKREADAADDFPHEIERRLRWIQESLLERPRQPHQTIAYGVFPQGSDVAVCTCELVLSDRGQLAGSWLKLLNVTMSPEIESSIGRQEQQATMTALHAYKAAVLGSFASRLEHDADTLKLYGRNEAQLTFLMALLAVLQDSKEAKLKAKREGRWLVLRTN